MYPLGEAHNLWRSERHFSNMCSQVGTPAPMHLTQRMFEPDIVYTHRLTKAGDKVTCTVSFTLTRALKNPRMLNTPLTFRC